MLKGNARDKVAKKAVSVFGKGSNSIVTKTARITRFVHAAEDNCKGTLVLTSGVASCRDDCKARAVSHM